MRKIIIICSVFYFQLLSISTWGQEVVLVRHAKVDMAAKGWMGPGKASAYKKKYDSAPIENFLPDTVLAKIPQRITDTVYVSALPRSIITAWKLYGDSVTLVSMPGLNEFELRIVRLPLVLPYKAWTSVSRALWLTGVHKKEFESYKEAKKRIQLVVDFIEENAEGKEQVILVTHGFLNRNIAKEMKKRGWQVTKNKGNKNLGATLIYK